MFGDDVTSLRESDKHLDEPDNFSFFDENCCFIEGKLSKPGTWSKLDLVPERGSTVFEITGTVGSV